MTDERPAIDASLEESHANLRQWCAAASITVEEFGRIAGVTMWPPYGTMPDEIPLVGDHEDIDELALPELRRPAEDAPIAMLLGHLVGLLVGRLRRVLPWGWRTVWDSGVNLYQQHTDGRRRAKYYGPGNQPLDVRWLAGGERFDPRAISPPPGPSGVRPLPPPQDHPEAGQQSRALWTSVAATKRAAAQAQTGRRRD